MSGTKIINVCRLMLAVLFTGCAMEYSSHITEGQFSYAVAKDKAFVYEYVWDGSEEAMTVEIPDEVQGRKVVGIGGFQGRGVPTPFDVNISAYFGDNATMKSNYGEHDVDRNVEMTFVVNCPADVSIDTHDSTVRYYECDGVMTQCDIDYIFVRRGVDEPAVPKLKGENNDVSLCGTYRYEAEEEWMSADVRISEIGGRSYLEYIGESDYAAAEMELLDETAYINNDQVGYMVRLYPFSGFSFMGEYWGEGKIVSFVINKDGSIKMGDSQPFWGNGSIELARNGDEEIHPVAKTGNENSTMPDIVGCWCSEEAGKITYMELGADGTAYIVQKSRGYVPEVYIGTYEPDTEADTVKLLTERLGYGTQPMGDWILKVNAEAGTIEAVNGDGDAAVCKPATGNVMALIEAGPSQRNEEVLLMWEEYNSMGEEEQEVVFYDYPPEFVEHVVESAMKIVNADDYSTYGFQTNNGGGEMWICLFNNDSMTKTWLRYDVATGEYEDMFGTKYQE